MIKYLIFDTETTGLNIREDYPFLVPYALVDNKLNIVNKHMFDPRKGLDAFIKHLKQVDTLVGHNIKFDVNMMINAGVDPLLFRDKNYIDTTVLARLVIPQDTQIGKGFSIALKRLGVRYLGVDSSQEEHILKTELSQLTLAHKQKMKEFFIDQGVWDTSLKSTQETKIINHVYNKWKKYYHLYPDLKVPRRNFLKQHPAPNYSNCSNINKYAMKDVEITHGLFKLWYPEVIRLKQIPTLVRISKATFPLVTMERQGMTINLARILRDRNAILQEQKKTKIIDPRTNKELSIGQHAKLKELYEYESGMALDSADKATRKKIRKSSPAAGTADYLSKMEKYISTYITGMLNKLTIIDGEYKVFTQYNLAGTVTGRLSSDFQQFPSKPLELKSGYKINIRDWFIVPKKNKYMFYFDYSQMELRLQCEWTNVVNGSPDENMARAFSPYNCHRNDPTLGKVAYDGAPSNFYDNYQWYLNESPTIQWQPIDLHGLTAKNAFPGIDEKDPNWKEYRDLGKRTNFAVNYGAAAPRIATALGVDFKTATALVEGYKVAYAGIVRFGKWLQNRTYTTNNIPNLLLRRYYSRNKHLMQNWLVQGSGADILLEKTAELYEYIKDKPHWNLMLSVHDENGLVCDDIPRKQLDKEAKEIQKIMAYQLSAVDIIVDKIEYTETTWASKKEWTL